MHSLKASKPFSVNGSIVLLPFSIKRSIKDFRTAKISRIILYDKITKVSQVKIHKRDLT